MTTAVLNRFVCAVVLGAVGAVAMGQDYSLTATASATGSTTVVDETSTGASVLATNTGGSTSPDNPSSVSTSAAGSPNEAVCGAFAAAESSGPNGEGAGFASLRAVSDRVFFDASGPFTVRVSLALAETIETNWSNDFGRVEASGAVRRRRADGALFGSPGFAYRRTVSNGNSTITTDRRDPIEFAMEPGDSLVLSLSLTSTATARASFKISDGNVRVNASARLHLEITEGDASVSGSQSGASYGPPPCNAADLADPRGLLDLADINAFVAGFTSDDLIADLDENGLLDLADIELFVQAFSAGCP